VAQTPLGVKAKPLAEHGGDRKSEEIQVCDSNLKVKGGTNEYYTARIARDAPDVLERMKAGEFCSVAEAERAAGILKEVTGLDLLKRAWGKASQEEREAFLAWVEGCSSTRVFAKIAPRIVMFSTLAAGMTPHSLAERGGTRTK
jgi:hypothetical protein